MAPDRKQAASFAPEPAAREGDVRKRGDVLHAVLVVGKAHRPEQHAAPGRYERVHGAVHVLALQAGICEKGLPRRRPRVGLDGIPALDVVPHVRAIDAVFFDDPLEERLETRDVRSHVRLKVDVGNIRAEQHRSGSRGDLEAEKAELFHGIDDDHRPAAFLDLDQLHDQPRVIRRRIRARHDRHIGFVEIVEHQC